MKKLITVAVLVLSLMVFAGCSKDSKPNSDAQAKYKAGTYTSEQKGYGGNLKVEVTVSDSKIESITVGDNQETKEIGGKAIEELTNKIISEQKPEQDAVSGATVTSKAFLDAVKDALSQAENK